MRRLFLDFPPPEAPAGNWVILRDLCGGDEESVTGTGTAQAIMLLDRLLVPAAGAALGPGDAQALTATDRDRLLAAIYAAEFGSRIDCVIRCDACGEPFDIDFRLPDLMASVDLAPADVPTIREPEMRLADGRLVRLPRGNDELELFGLPPENAEATLLARCMLEGDAEPGDAAVLEALERAAPILDVDLDAACPECGAAVQAHFDLQHYLLAAIAQEGPSRIAEIHLLAATYGWSLDEILALGRGRRRAFAMAIERDRGAHAGGL
jgi:hypothetical protein